MSKKYKAESTVERFPKEVIENQLLAALDDKSKVAIIADKEDLEMLIAALDHCPRGWGDKPMQFRAEIQQLLTSAFGK